jgi:hypothetical protein
MLLGDMGADVIKIEPPGSGDQTRRSMGFRLKGTDSGGFLALNRNKRSVEINLKNAAGREAFYELVRGADILVENNRPGVAARLQIDYPTLKAIMLSAQEARDAGFVSEIVEPEKIDRRAAELVDRLAHNAPVTMRVSKEAIRRVLASAQLEADDLIEEAYGSADFRQGVASFVEKRQPEWSGR